MKLRPQLRARDVHGVVDQVLDDLIHVAAVEAHLRELRRFHLDERRVRDLREAPRDLGLAAPRGTDHEDVFGDDLVAKRRVDAVATPAVPERDRARALRVRLADDELIKEFHGLRRGEAVRAAERGAELLRERHRFVFPPFGRRRAAGSASGRRGGRRRRRRRRRLRRLHPRGGVDDGRRRRRGGARGEPARERRRAAHRRGGGDGSSRRVREC